MLASVFESMGSSGIASGFHTNTEATSTSRAQTARVQIDNEPASTPETSEANPPKVQKNKKDCYFIAVSAFLIVAGSTTIALYFLIAQNRMQDGFSAASNILAAGTMLLGPWIAMHYPRCSCRRPWCLRSNCLSSDNTDIALVPLTRTSTIDAL